MKNILKRLTPSEWICVFFLLFSALRLALASNEWSLDQSQFSLLTIRDLLFIPIPILILNAYRDQKKILWVLILLAILCYCSFFPTLIGVQAKKALHDFRWYFVAAFFSSLFYQERKNLNPSKLWVEIREISPLYIMILLYPFTPLVIKATHTVDYDSTLQRLDTLLFLGHNPQQIAESLMTPWLSEWMAFSYTVYAIFVLLVFSMLFLKKKRDALREFILMTTLCLAVGYTLYAFVPAQGPVFTQSFTVNLDLYYMDYVKKALMDATRIDRDCFPSLHTAISIVCLFSAWRHLKPLFWIMLPMVLTIPFACVYLRYHYVTDVLAGFMLAGAAIWINGFAEEKGSAHDGDR